MLLGGQVRGTLSMPLVLPAAVALVLFAISTSANPTSAVPTTTSTSSITPSCTAGHGPHGPLPDIYLFPLDIESANGTKLVTNFTGQDYSLGEGDLAAVGSNRLTIHLTGRPDGQGNTVFRTVDDADYDFPAGLANSPWTICDNSRLAFAGDDGFAWCSVDGKDVLYGSTALSSSAPSLGAQHCQAVRLVPHFGPEDNVAAGVPYNPYAGVSVTISHITDRSRKDRRWTGRTGTLDGDCWTDLSTFFSLNVAVAHTDAPWDPNVTAFFRGANFSLANGVMWLHSGLDGTQGEHCVSLDDEGQVLVGKCSLPGGQHGDWCIGEAGMLVRYKGSDSFLWCTPPHTTLSGALYPAGTVKKSGGKDGATCYNAAFWPKNTGY